VLRNLDKEVTSGLEALFGGRSATAGRKRTRANRLRFEPLEKRLLLEVGPLLISELMADNRDTLDDEDGNSRDWIEIYNSSDSTISLNDYYLTDDPTDLTQWQFPAVSIDAHDYLIVFASEKDRADPDGELHTNFRLDEDGESVALVKPDGETVVHAYWDFPDQLEDVSYGLPDTTTLWDQLVSPGMPAGYHVPFAGEDVLAWTEQNYDDSGWTDAVSLDPADLVITEASTGETDCLEIQNVSDQSIDTAGWFVAINDTSSASINDANSVVWNLPYSIAAGEVLFKTDDPTEEYWGSEISWETGSGWAMIVDSSGEIVDFVPWGYGEAEIAAMRVDAGGFTDITVTDQWHGDGVPGGAGDVELVNIEHTWSYDDSNTDLGTQWRELGYDDSLWDSGEALLYHESSGLPAPKNTPLTLGASTYYFRSHFTLDAHPDSVTQLDLSTVVDDGAVIYLNGQEVYRVGIKADEPISHGYYIDRTVGNASYEGPFTIDLDTLPPGTLVTGENLIAVEVHQTNSGSSDVVMGLELNATVLEPALERVGNSDVNNPGDFDLPTEPSLGAQNPGLTLPFVPGTIPALTGLGFSDDGNFDDLVQTDVYQAMYDTNASLWTRIEFPVGDPSQFDVLTLNMQYDDGFVAYLNGKEVAARNDPDPLAYDSAATAEHHDAQAVVSEVINISDSLFMLRPLETNVLAIHGLNFSADDGDFLIMPELIATSHLDGPQYMTDPTPGEDNLAGALGLVDDTEFNEDRGFFDEAFDLEIVTDTIAAEIRYTLDGSTPTATTGEVYTGPITIETTTVVRAAAYKPGYIPTNVDTQTYIFLNDVVSQPNAPEGFPAMWGGTTADYEMDPDVIGNFDDNGNPLGGDLYSGTYADKIRDSLLSIPTISIVTETDNLFGPDGIYTNSGGQGLNYERPASVEWINTDGTTGFQVDAGLRIYGGAFRGMGLTRKKTFRLLFKGIYGPTKLDFPLFDAEDAATKFDTIILRGGANDGWNNWGKQKTQYIVDEYMRRTQLALGQPAGHGTFAHLYLNGLYWGLYNPVERPEASFAATYFGGEKEEWDAINSGAATGESSTATWNELRNFDNNYDLSTMEDYQRLQGNDPDGTPNPAYTNLLDVDNYIAYMFSNFWGGTGDWPGHNWYGACKKPPESTGYKFFNWDSEGAIVIWSSLNANVTGVNNSLAEPYAALKNNEEFKLLFADYAHQWLYNGGPATSGPSYQRYKELADEVELAIIAESARWGDQASATPYTQAHWSSQCDYILNTYMPQRPDIVLNQLRDPGLGLYPSLSAPVVTPHGGHVDAGFELTMTVPSGGGGVYTDTLVIPEFSQAKYFVPADDSLGTSWTERGFDDFLWNDGETGLGYERSPADYQNLIRTPVTPHDVQPGSTSILLRIPFTIDDVSVVDRLKLRMKYDDGFVAYINGHRVASRNFSGTPSWNSEASNHSDGQAVNFEDVLITDPIDPGDPILLQDLLVDDGENVLAIHALNTDTGSSDMLISPALEVGTLVEDPTAPGAYFTTDGSDPRLPGGAVSDSAILYDPDAPMPITESVAIKMRAYQSGQWSALNEVEFFVGQQATAENLVITEINYNPYDPPEGEEVYVDNDFEFIELYNRGDDTLDLSGLEFTEAVTFDFAAGDVTYLDPGEFVVVVANETAFAQRYDTSGMLLAGEYTGNLENAGEQLRLLDWQGAPIADFAYNDAGNWPGRADGKGASLELIDPVAVPDDDPQRTLYLIEGDHWRSSSEYGGSPGTAGTGPVADVVINEVLSHTDPPWTDSIELHNVTDAEILLTGWYLSDSSNNYLKFRIPDGTSIVAGGYLVFDENDFNPTPLDPAPTDFSLDGAHGEDVWLMETDAEGKLVRFVDHVDFGAAANGESFGRWPDWQGDLYPMLERTLGPVVYQNSGPRVGPVVISEVHYNHDWTDDQIDNDPLIDYNDDLEFVEIYNPTSVTVDLTNWRIRKGIDYNFPDDTLLAAGEALVIVPFDPDDDADLLAAFRVTHGIDDSVRIIGGYSGRLSDYGERVQLQRPDEPPHDEPDYYPRMVEDEVRYSSLTPWPAEAAGQGASLNRAVVNWWGNDAASWIAFDPTPGSAPLMTAAAVVDRHVFYNNSAFDGAGDENAVAHDKQALLPGNSASFTNYTSFDKGINGIMVDIDSLAGSTPGPTDFQFRVGNDDTPGDWAAATAPTVTVHPGQGTDGSDRVKMIWSDSTILNQWLQVTVLATPNTNLAVDDVFYFGNAVAESGNSAGDARVNAVDLLSARNNPRNSLNPAAIDFNCDFNRDKRVNATDMLLARSNQTHLLNTLQLISPSRSKAAADAGSGASSYDAVLAAESESGSPQENNSSVKVDWLFELERENTLNLPSKKDGSDDGHLLLDEQVSF